MLFETQASISAWAVETFGSAGTNASVAVRALKEAVELLELLVRPGGQVDVQDILAECADVAIVIVRNCERVGLQWNLLLAPGWHQRDEYTQLTGRDVSVLEMGRAACTVLAATLTREPADIGVVQYAMAMAQLRAFLEVTCLRHGGNLWEQVERKMVVNRQRKWVLDKHGHGQHAPEDYWHQE